MMLLEQKGSWEVLQGVGALAGPMELSIQPLSIQGRRQGRYCARLWEHHEWDADMDAAFKRSSQMTGEPGHNVGQIKSLQIGISAMRE